MVIGLLLKVQGDLTSILPCLLNRFCSIKIGHCFSRERSLVTRYSKRERQSEREREREVKTQGMSMREETERNNM